MWTIWIENNDLVFNKHYWFAHQVESTMWNLLMEYAKIAWKHAMSMICRALGKEVAFFV
jgi:hypothetical protein